jgi:hypothetical protein
LFSVAGTILSSPWIVLMAPTAWTLFVFIDDSPAEAERSHMVSGPHSCSKHSQSCRQGASCTQHAF